MDRGSLRISLLVSLCAGREAWLSSALVYGVYGWMGLLVMLVVHRCTSEFYLLEEHKRLPGPAAPPDVRSLV